MSGGDDALVALVAIALIALVSFVVLRPLFAGEAEEPADSPALAERRAELDAAKEAKYREIRDAELDLGMGKLSPEDHRAVDRELRGQAIEILRQVDELEGRNPEAARESDPARDEGSTGSGGPVAR